jgi:hypothetical protein
MSFDIVQSFKYLQDIDVLVKNVKQDFKDKTGGNKFEESSR